MGWKFWKMNETPQEVKDSVDTIREDIASFDGKLEMLTEQMKKMTRVQFKMAKNMEDSFMEFKSDIQEKNVQQVFRKQLDQYEINQQQLTGCFIQLLDEMDHLATGLTDEQRALRQLLEGWTHTISASLQGVGIHEVDVLGKVFDPTVAEAMGTVEQNESDGMLVPYQVMQVLTRGFVDENQRLLRKAKVVTLKET